ncbi:MAG TPA: TldD/PmbA family protein [Acidimicrobiia bacterium]|nr:TldD/PmbA family protein [Acidimicrobiia bacterium]
MNIDPDLISESLKSAKKKGASFAEAFCEQTSSAGTSLDEKRIDSRTTGLSKGVGIRVVNNSRVGYAYTSTFTREGLDVAVEAACASAGVGGSISPSGKGIDANLFKPDAAIKGFESDEFRDPANVTADRLREIDDVARSYHSSIAQASATIAQSQREVLIMNTAGVNVSDTQTRTRCVVQTIAKNSDGIQSAHEAPGLSVGSEYFDVFSVDDIAKIAAQRSITLLDAKPAPSGNLSVILKKGAGGVLFHEACGHGLEADHIDKAQSVFAGKVGKQVASSLVTLVDDGTMGDEWGTYRFDDEGNKAQKNTLIENGILKDYMWDVIRSTKLGHDVSGNGRRETYEFVPMVRMTNTYLESGTSEVDDIISSTEYGIYCVALGGGQVDTVTGEYVFGITEGYMVENGKITYPIRGATLIGNGLQTMLDIDMVGNDFETWTGTCGKNGQGVPVSAGQPTLRVSSMTVGGTSV